MLGNHPLLRTLAASAKPRGRRSYVAIAYLPSRRSRHRDLVFGSPDNAVDSSLLCAPRRTLPESGFPYVDMVSNDRAACVVRSPNTNPVDINLGAERDHPPGQRLRFEGLR